MLESTLTEVLLFGNSTFMTATNSFIFNETNDFPPSTKGFDKPLMKTSFKCHTIYHLLFPCRTLTEP